MNPRRTNYMYINEIRGVLQCNCTSTNLETDFELQEVVDDVPKQEGGEEEADAAGQEPKLRAEKTGDDAYEFRSWNGILYYNTKS